MPGDRCRHGPGGTRMARRERGRQAAAARATGGPPGYAEVIGVVEHMRLTDLMQDVRDEIFFPYPQGAPRDAVDPVITLRSE